MTYNTKQAEAIAKALFRLAGEPGGTLPSDERGPKYVSVAQG